ATQIKATDSEILSDCIYSLDWLEILISDSGSENRARQPPATVFDGGFETMTSTLRSDSDSENIAALETDVCSDYSEGLALSQLPDCRLSIAQEGQYPDAVDTWPVGRSSERQHSNAASQASSQPFVQSDGSSEALSWLAAGMTAQMLAAKVFDGTQDTQVNATASEDAEPSLRGFDSGKLNGPQFQETPRFNDGCNGVSTTEIPNLADPVPACVYPDCLNPAQANYRDTLQRNWAFRGCEVPNPINPFFQYNKSTKPILSSAEPGDALYQFGAAIYGYFKAHPWSLWDAYEYNHHDSFPDVNTYRNSFKNWRSSILRELALMRNQLSKQVRAKYVPSCVDTLWQCVRFGFVGVDPAGAIQWVSYPADEQDNASVPSVFTVPNGTQELVEWQADDGDNGNGSPI
ncbi:hypothetical protein HDU81_009238, partial [Chytriomyces hyalinus]